MENVKKCKNFLSTLIKLASSGKQSTETAANVKELVQNLLVRALYAGPSALERCTWPWGAGRGQSLGPSAHHTAIRSPARLLGTSQQDGSPRSSFSAPSVARHVGRGGAM